MPLMDRRRFVQLLALGIAGRALAPALALADAVSPGAISDIRAFGAVGDGKTIDSPAINRAIAAAAATGGGIVRVPAGTYASHSIRLASFVTLVLEPGSTLLAADAPGYDAAGSNAPWEAFQDFGHNHWHNALIWGEDVHDVAILGPGRIWGRGLSGGLAPDPVPGLPAAEMSGSGDKAIALKRCRNVTLRDFSILAAGHFGILATGVDNLTIDNLAVDTNRDGINIDGCRDVQIANCRVNSPRDDGICLKSSFALGEARATENVSITGCHVMGYELGSMLNGTFRPIPAGGPVQPIGRIKFGTESNGGFRNISIGNCTFTSCRGLAIETVDGGAIEDVSITGVTMRDIRNAPFFLRLGARLRGPRDAAPGVVRRVIISGVTCEASGSDMPAIISGIPGHPIEDVSIADVHLVMKGGGTAEAAAIVPPEREQVYPEASCFGPLPAQGLFVRHARNVSVRNLSVTSLAPDARPVCWLADVDGAEFEHLKPPGNAGGSVFSLRDTTRFAVADSRPVPDTVFDAVSRKALP